MNGDEIFEEAALNWRDNRGIGTALVPAPLNDKVLLYKVLSKMYARNPTGLTVIVVESMIDRNEIIDFLTHQDCEENNKEFNTLIYNKLIRIFTKKFLLGNWSTLANLCILYRPESYGLDINLYFSGCHYRLAIINKLLTTENNEGKLFNHTPILNCFKQNEIDEIRVSSPVEEMWVGVNIPEDSESWKLYQYYCKYIETSLNIFGSFDIMQQARLGNETLNISSTVICNQIAEENGWNEHLDMSYAFNQKIDELYNPNALRERATNTYDIIRKRTNLLSDYEGKLEKILDLVKTNAGDKILIISYRGEFATKVTNFINDNNDTTICGNYHNKVDDIPAVDIDGNPVFIKSGREKGKRKSMGYRAQMTLNERKFNLNKLSCLSMNKAPDKSLSVDFNTVIITSPLCEDIRAYLYRLANIKPINNKIKLFSVFCKDTLEQQKLIARPINGSHDIVNKDEFAPTATNNFDFVIVD